MSELPEFLLAWCTWYNRYLPKVWYSGRRSVELGGVFYCVPLNATINNWPVLISNAHLEMSGLCSCSVCKLTGPAISCSTCILTKESIDGMLFDCEIKLNLNLLIHRDTGTPVVVSAKRVTEISQTGCMWLHLSNGSHEWVRNHVLSICPFTQGNYVPFYRWSNASHGPEHLNTHSTFKPKWFKSKKLKTHVEIIEPPKFLN